MVKRLRDTIAAAFQNDCDAFGDDYVEELCGDDTHYRHQGSCREMGSFDAGYGTWYLEDLVGKKKAKEMWYLNPRLSAKEALEIGLINRVVPDDKLREETRKMALEVADRGAFALASSRSASVSALNPVSNGQAFTPSPRAALSLRTNGMPRIA